jgi:hypothetical protein
LCAFMFPSAHLTLHEGYKLRKFSLCMFLKMSPRPFLLNSKPCSQIEQQLYLSYWRQKLKDRYTSTIPKHRPVYQQTPPPPIVLIFLATHVLLLKAPTPPLPPAPLQTPVPSVTLTHAFCYSLDTNPQSSCTAPLTSRRYSVTAHSVLYTVFTFLCVPPVHRLIKHSVHIQCYCYAQFTHFLSRHAYTDLVPSVIAHSVLYAVLRLPPVHR